MTTLGIFRIKPSERLLTLLALAVILAVQWLFVGRFWRLFAHYSDDSFRQFVRNFHMSGFDPITYDVVTRWHEGYDILRHPLLALMMWPLHALNGVLWHATGCNCVQLVCGALLTFCGVYSVLFVYRTITGPLRLDRLTATLLSLLFLAFAYVIVSIIVPDHFCLSMFCLTLTVWLASEKMARGDTFTARQPALLFVVTAGITLTNGVVVLMAVLLTNRRDSFNRCFLLWAVAVPMLFLAVAVAGQQAMSDELGRKEGTLVGRQMKWTSQRATRWDVLHENFFGESLQLHRKHVLGDVLRDRPVIVKYNWRVQKLLVYVMEALLAAGLVAGWRRRLTWLLAGVLGFNLLLHLGLGFAFNEVYIMTAHWAFVIPIAIATLWHRSQRYGRWVLAAVVMLMAVYLYVYHGYLLYRYLTWPLVK